jgi:hypothetical protein
MRLSTSLWVSSLSILQQKSRRRNKEKDGTGKREDFKRINEVQNRSWRRSEGKKTRKRKNRRGIFARLPFACSRRAQVFLRSSRIREGTN